jgi:hypothetical protein
VDVHDPDVAVEESGRFDPSKLGLRGPQMIGERPVQEARTLRTQQMLANDGEMATGLRRRESTPIIACVIGIREKERPVWLSLG